ncbi:hypothetical protein EVA_11612 [gut metagenome]|uniref:Uncharacterized protein n=1 Tax=gut metagenome TaxID=749906 RepID=J9CJN1_9ZZZZ
MLLAAAIRRCCRWTRSTSTSQVTSMPSRRPTTSLLRCSTTISSAIRESPAN